MKMLAIGLKQYSLHEHNSEFFLACICSDVLLNPIISGERYKCEMVIQIATFCANPNQQLAGDCVVGSGRFKIDYLCTFPSIDTFSKKMD